MAAISDWKACTCGSVTPAHTPRHLHTHSWIAYLGAANAGIPLSIIVKDYGWGTYFSTLIGACCLALLLLAPMTNLRSYVQRREQRRLRKGL